MLLVTGDVAGGIGRHVHQLAGGLTGRGHRVTVACPSVVAARFGFAAVATEVVTVPIGARPSPHRDRRTVMRLRQTLRGVDVVHAHGVRAGALAGMARPGAAAEGSEASTRPVLVVTMHNAAPHGRLAGLAYRTLEHLVSRNADLVLGVSEDLVQRAQECGAADVGRAVVPGDLARPSTPVAQVRAGLELGEGVPLVVSVGRLAAQKGLERLVDEPVLDVLRRHGAHLVVAGDGPQRQALQRRIERSGAPVTLLGHRDDVADVLRAADLVVSPARWEGQPLWLQEALRAGAPVVATSVGGTPEVLGDAALLVPGDDVQALAAAMDAVLQDPELRRRLSGRAVARATLLPSVDDGVAAALAAYARAASTDDPARG